MSMACAAAPAWLASARMDSSVRGVAKWKGACVAGTRHAAVMVTPCRLCAHAGGWAAGVERRRGRGRGGDAHNGLGALHAGTGK